MEKTILIMDIESDKFVAEDKKPINFRFAVFFNSNFEKLITNRDDFDKFIVSLCKRNNGKNKNYIVFAHNLMFDFSFCIRPLLEAGYILKPIENGGKLISVKVGKEKRKIRKSKKGVPREVLEFDTYLEFRDSFALFQTSLKNLGQFVGLEKIEHDKDFKEELTAADIEYCRRDCEIVFQALTKMHDFYETIMHESVDMSKLPPTTASFAFRVFLKKNSIYSSDEEKDICPWINTDEGLNEMFLKEYYFGGRVELFKSELIHNVNYYDINSLYPSVMVKYNFHMPPYSIVDFSVHDLESEFTVGYFAEIDERNEVIPLIPIHFNEGLYFPASIKQGFIFKEEYDYLKSRGVSIKISNTLVSKYPPSNPFGYLKEFYEMKKKKDTMSYFYKILLNATYGRFGIDNEKEVIRIKKIESDTDLLNENAFPIDNEDGLDEWVKIIETKDLQFKRNVVLAAKITALARLELSKYLHLLNDNGIQIYYCDTDSIVCENNDILPLGKELGQFKKEHVCNVFCGLGNKEYVLKTDEGQWVVKLKGVHNADLQSVFDYHSDGVSQLNVSKLRTILNSGQLNTPHNIVVLKKSRSTYHKRYLSSFRPINDISKLKEVELENAVIIAETMEKLGNYLNK